MPRESRISLPDGTLHQIRLLRGGRQRGHPATYHAQTAGRAYLKSEAEGKEGGGCEMAMEVLS